MVTQAISDLTASQDIVPAELALAVKSAIVERLDKWGRPARLRTFIDTDRESGWRQLLFEVSSSVRDEERVSLWNLLLADVETLFEGLAQEMHNHRQNIGIWVRPEH